MNNLFLQYVVQSEVDGFVGTMFDAAPITTVLAIDNGLKQNEVRFPSLAAIPVPRFFTAPGRIQPV